MYDMQLFLGDNTTLAPSDNREVCMSGAHMPHSELVGCTIDTYRGGSSVMSNTNHHQYAFNTV